MTDVLVIGGGMAGVIAALKARADGREVVLVRQALGATAMSSGAVDVAPPRRRDDGTIDDDLLSVAASMARHRPEHPFAILSPQLPRLMESLRFAADATQGLLAPPAAKVAWLPTAFGTFKPAAMAQSSQVAGALAALPSVVGVVDFAGTNAMDAAFVARSLTAEAAALGKAVRFIPVSVRALNDLADALRPPFELATRVEGLTGVIAAELERADAAAFLFPPVLGLKAVHEQLAKALRRPCAELLAAAHGSVPGLRLQRALDAALSRAGLRIREGAVRREVRGFSAPAQTTAQPESAGLREEGGAENRLTFGDEVMAARAVILATGKFIGGGIRRETKLRETVFDAPVFVTDRRGPEASIFELLGERYGDDQPVFRAGVRIDSELRVAGAGRPNVFAAGSVISGFDPAQDGSGLGVAIFTGYLAGERAAAA